MFKDLLQKRLQEVERVSPSPSLETTKQTLKESVGFLGRYFSKTVEQVPQRSSIYDSLDGQLKDYKCAVEFEGHRGQGQYWVNEAFEEARSGEVWGDIKTYLRIAEDETGFAGSISPELMQKLQTLYSEGIKIEGPKKARFWVNKAFEEARSGELLGSIKADLSIARDYARESGVPLEVDMNRLDEIYKQCIKLHGPEKVNYWRKKAGEELASGEPKEDVEASLSIARDYARESGVEFKY